MGRARPGYLCRRPAPQGRLEDLAPGRRDAAAARRPDRAEVRILRNGGSAGTAWRGVGSRSTCRPKAMIHHVGRGRDAETGPAVCRATAADGHAAYRWSIQGTGLSDDADLR